MLHSVPHTLPHVGRSCEHFPNGFELYLLPGGHDPYARIQREELPRHPGGTCLLHPPLVACVLGWDAFRSGRGHFTGP